MQKADSPIFDTSMDYLNSLPKHRLLSPDQMAEMCRRRDEAPDEAEANRIISHIVAHNLGLAKAYVKSIGTKWPQADDTIQDAILGLHRAARKFDPSLGFTFSTYADKWIRLFVSRGIHKRSEGRPFVVPHRIYTASIAVQKHGESGLSRKVRNDAKYCRRLDSRNAPIDKFIAVDNDSVEAIDAMDEVEFLVNSIQNETHRSMLRMRFGIGYDQPFTYKEIARRFSVSRQRVYQIITLNLERMRQSAAAI